MEGVQQHPAYMYNQIALRLGVAGAAVATTAVVLLYPYPVNFQIGAAVALLGFMFLLIRQYLLPRARTLLQMDMIVSGYLLPIYVIQAWSITLAPDKETSTGTGCLIVMSGLLFTSTAAAFLTAMINAALWLTVKATASGSLTPNEFMQLLIMAPTSALITRFSVTRTVSILQESRLREQQRVVELQDALNRLQTETLLRQESEARLLQAQKRESLGTMAAGVAHDFNNTLRGITAVAELISSESKDPVARTAAEQICNAVTHAAGVCHQMLTYSGRSTVTKQLLDLTQLVQQILPLIRASLTSRVNVRMSSDATVSLVYGNATQLQQVVMNLLNNSADAMHGDGEIAVRVGDRVIAAEDVARERGWILPPPPGRYVEMSVRDQGCGIPAEAISQIFDPYFTTKSHGHGLGLSNVHGIALSHQAALQISSRVDDGTAVTLLFPTVSPELDHMSKVTPNPSRMHPANESTEILVVEDDDLVRTPLVRMLQLMGWQVVEASSGEAAVAMTRQRIDFAAILVDYSMTGMNGRETLRAIRANGCHCPAILCSGYISVAEDTAYEEDFNGFLQKPFRCQDLEVLLKQLTGK